MPKLRCEYEENKTAFFSPEYSIRLISMRTTISIVGVLALFLCFVSIRDVPHNPAIRNPEPTMTILWVAVALILSTGILALIRNSKVAAAFSLVVNGLAILFSLLLACV